MAAPRSVSSVRSLVISAALFISTLRSEEARFMSEERGDSPSLGLRETLETGVPLRDAADDEVIAAATRAPVHPEQGGRPGCIRRRFGGRAERQDYRLKSI